MDPRDKPEDDTVAWLSFSVWLPELAGAARVLNSMKRGACHCGGVPPSYIVVHAHLPDRRDATIRATQDSLARLEALAKLMDGAFVIPGTNIRMGLDGIIGLVPIAGDLVSGLISSYLIWEARQLGASRWVIGRMMANTLIDTTIGAIPVLGDAFDIVFRTNLRNMALLASIWPERAWPDRAPAPSSTARLFA